MPVVLNVAASMLHAPFYCCNMMNKAESAVPCCAMHSVCAVPQCGPRFELRPYQIKLGTVDQAHAENEWVLRAYTRSTKKAKLALEDEEA
jgi:hypothetical protein